MIRMALFAAAATAALPAWAQTCAELGERYIMYTYKAGNRVGVHVREPERRYMISLGCKYNAAESGIVVDLGFGKLCPGAEARVKGLGCKVSKIEPVKEIKVDPNGAAIVRRAAPKK